MEQSIIESMKFTQAIINRMASNSFMLKAWFLAAFTALFAFFAKSDSKILADLIWVLPLFTFAYLDGYYLKQERIFRDVYKDFSILARGENIERKVFDMTPRVEQLNKYSVLNCVFSVSVGGLYFPLVSAYWMYIVFHTTDQMDCWQKWLLVFLMPIVLIVLACILKKKTDHAKGIKSNG